MAPGPFPGNDQTNKKMKKVLYYSLSGEEKLDAISKMFGFHNQYNYPNGSNWESEEELSDDIEQGFSPDEYFNFYVNTYEVVVKIG